MTKRHVSSCEGTEMCKPQAHKIQIGDPTPIAPRTSRHFLLAAAVCMLLGSSAFAPSHALAQADDDILPSNEEEILREAIENPSEFKAAPGARGNNFCQIVLVNEGNLHEIPGTYKLSSKGGGGRPGVAQVTTSNSSYRVTVDQPLGFINAPFGGNSSVLMKASYSGSGSSNFSETPGDIEQKLKRGTTTIETNLVAERSDGTPFPAGRYTAELTLRCE